jgi:hypothetical protein
MYTTHAGDSTHRNVDDAIQRRLAQGQHAASSPVGDLASPLLLQATRDLIEIYERDDVPYVHRHAASQIVARLSDTYPAALTLVIEHARSYAESQHIDDAFPYAPNSFDVLAVSARADQVVEFLREVVAQDYGIPRWAAISALCSLEETCGAAAKVVSDVVAGKYPPCRLKDTDSLAVAAALRSRSRVAQVPAVAEWTRVDTNDTIQRSAGVL